MVHKSASCVAKINPATRASLFVLTLLLLSPAIIDDAIAGDAALHIKMADPVRRRVIKAAAHDGAITLAVSARAGYYRGADDPHGGLLAGELRQACEALPPDRRYACPECVAIADFDAYRVADMKRRAQLYRPGFWRAHSLKALDAWHETPEAHRTKWSEYADLRFLDKFYWDNSVWMSYWVADRKDATHMASLDEIYMRRDAKSDRYWINRHNELPLGEIPYGASVLFGASQSYAFKGDEIKAMKEPPKQASAWRVRLDPNNQPADPYHKPRKFIVEKIDRSDPNAIALNDLILYIREDPLPPNETPFLQIDPTTLDQYGNILQHQLTTLFQSRINPTKPALDIWHPNTREVVQGNFDNERKAGSDEISAIPPSAGFLMSGLQSLHLVTRVFTDEGVVWYGWTTLDNGGKLNGKNRIVMKIFQCLSDGKYKLCSLYTKPANWLHHFAFTFLYNDDLASALVESHLHDEALPD